MKIVRFTEDLVRAAEKLALENYAEERACVPELPEVNEAPGLSYFAKNDLGVAAVEDGRLLGYLCFYKPWEGAFDMYDALGTYSPIHAHAAVKENRAVIYQDMFEALAKKLADRDVLAYGIGLYEHDAEGKRAFFEYGFGQRCADHIRSTESLGEMKISDLEFEELPVERFPEIRELRRALNDHLLESPCFLQCTGEECEGWLEKVEKGDRRTFVAKRGGEVIAYIDVTDEGENYITEVPQMMNICGAYCVPEYRGTGAYRDLLNHLLAVMREEGYTLLGVDNESYNPTANRFWKKYFKPYTCSVVRRIEVWCRRPLPEK